MRLSDIVYLSHQVEPLESAEPFKLAIPASFRPQPSDMKARRCCIFPSTAMCRWQDLPPEIDSRQSFQLGQRVDSVACYRHVVDGRLSRQVRSTRKLRSIAGILHVAERKMNVGNVARGPSTIAGVELPQFRRDSLFLRDQVLVTSVGGPIHFPPGRHR